LPSGEKATVQTVPACPFRTASSFTSWGSSRAGLSNRTARARQRQTVRLIASHSPAGSGDDLPDRLAVVDGPAVGSGHLQLARVEPQLVQDGRVDVRDVVPMLDGVEADLVRRSVNDSTLDAAAGHQHREAVDVMVPPVGALRARRAAELARKDHDG